MQDQRTKDQKLSELDSWQVHDSDLDVRGRQLIRTSGTELGTIEDMLVDTERARVSAILLENGRSFPVESLEIRDEAVITHEPGAERGSSIIFYKARLIRPIR